jgi:RNA polymerase subunit RPABC4/transcription elongation factor Spt4/uncharacterized membrane protein YgdD (TMEM256/DUF423 family)
MVEYVMIYGPQEALSSWSPYKSVPKYLGTMLVLLGIIFCLWGSIKRKDSNLVEWGGIFSLFGLVFFSGSGYEEVYIQYTLFQTYASFPVGMFIPIIFWFLIFIRPQGVQRYAKGLSSVKSKSFCGQCGREISYEFEFCPFCGNKINKIKCKTCGKSISVQNTFCPYCGSKTQNEPEKALIL